MFCLDPATRPAAGVNGTSRAHEPLQLTAGCLTTTRRRACSLREGLLEAAAHGSSRDRRNNFFFFFYGPWLLRLLPCFTRRPSPLWHVRWADTLTTTRWGKRGHPERRQESFTSPPEPEIKDHKMHRGLSVPFPPPPLQNQTHRKEGWFLLRGPSLNRPQQHHVP